ncbi:MAG: response regulator [Planctomycetota bacterium]|jgi:DNA-binding NarL/FixJ family response regulator
MAIRVLLVDDHKILRNGLCSLLQQQGDMEVVGETDNGAAAVRLAREFKPDVIIMDVNILGMDGIDATRHIMQELADSKIIALSMHSKKVFVTEMLKAGASGYMLKEQAFDELVQAIRTVLAGETYLSSKVVNLVVQDYVQSHTGTIGAGKTSLTERQRQILKFLADGKPSKEIAALLDVSVKTIDASRRKIFEKLNIQSTAELVKYAIREGFTSLES